MCDIEISKDKIKSFLDKTFEGKSHQGVGMIIVGGPGSGKNTIAPALLSSAGLDEKTFALIDPDLILKNIYNNKEPCRPSADSINDFLFDTVLQKHVDFIYCGTGHDSKFYISDVIQRSKKKNYKIYLSILANTSEVTIPRIIKRTLDTGRTFNIEYIKRIYSKIGTSILAYMNLDCSDVDGIFVIDTSTKKPTFLYTSSCENGIKSVKCYDVQHQYSYITEFCPSLWKEITTILSLGVILAILNGIIAYYAIHVYQLHWSVLLLTSAILSYCTAMVRFHRNTPREIILISLCAAISVFFVLSHDFDLSTILGISLLSGIMTGYGWSIAK